MRFAHSEEVALRDLLQEALDTIGDSITMRELNAGRIPEAGLACTPYINTLIDALERKGVYSSLPTHLHDQASIFKHMSASCVSNSPQLDLDCKIRKTFADQCTEGLNFAANWYTSL